MNSKQLKLSEPKCRNSVLPPHNIDHQRRKSGPSDDTWFATAREKSAVKKNCIHLEDRPLSSGVG